MPSHKILVLDSLNVVELYLRKFRHLEIVVIGKSPDEKELSAVELSAAKTRLLDDPLDDYGAVIIYGLKHCHGPSVIKITERLTTRGKPIIMATPSPHMSREIRETYEKAGVKRFASIGAQLQEEIIGLMKSGHLPTAT